MSDSSDSELYIQAASFSGIRDAAAELGHDVMPILDAVGIEVDLIESANGLIPFGDLCQVLETCATQWQVPDFGLRVAQHQSLQILGSLGFLSRSESSVGNALAVISENLFLQSNAPVVVVDDDGDPDVAAILIDVIPSNFSIRQYVERVIGVARNILVQLSDAPVELIEVHFRHERVSSAQRIESFFGCPVQFRAPHNALYFDRAILDRPMRQAGSTKNGMLKAYFERALRSSKRTAKQSVSLEIARRMEAGYCDIESVAEALGTEPRTLQRRLREEGANFRELVDQWRRDRALVLVTQTKMPLSEVAENLGYAEQSTFSTAFKRWFLETPLKVRQSSQSGFS